MVVLVRNQLIFENSFLIHFGIAIEVDDIGSCLLFSKIYLLGILYFFNPFQLFMAIDFKDIGIQHLPLQENK